MVEWEFQIGRFDIRYALIPLNILSASPRDGHRTRLINIFGYLQTVPAKAKSIVVSYKDIGEIKGKGADTKLWLEKYPDVSEEIY